jgi:multidrug efflux pump subunit AcrB
MNLSEPFIRRPVATSLIMAALALLGIVAFPFLPVSPLPQVDFPTVQVTATLAGASAETMASSVAAPLERQFGQIPGITQLTSVSSLGVSQVVIQFDLNRNIDFAAQDVQAAITAASKFLPQAMTYPPIYRKVNPADAPIMMLWAHSDTLPLTTVHDYLDNLFIQSLSQLPGGRAGLNHRRSKAVDPGAGRPGQACLHRLDAGRSTRQYRQGLDQAKPMGSPGRSFSS